MPSSTSTRTARSGASKTSSSNPGLTRTTSNEPRPCRHPQCSARTARLSRAGRHACRAGIGRGRAARPAPASRCCMGAGEAADRGSRRQPAEANHRDARRAADPACAPPPRRVDGRLLPGPARLRAADDPAFVERAGRTAAADRISADRPRSGPDDAAAREGARRAGRPPGHDPRARRPCRRQRHSDARLGERGRTRGGGGRGRSAPARSGSRLRATRAEPRSNRKLPRALPRPSARASTPCCSTA